MKTYTVRPTGKTNDTDLKHIFNALDLHAGDPRNHADKDGWVDFEVGGYEIYDSWQHDLRDVIDELDAYAFILPEPSTSHACPHRRLAAFAELDEVTA